MDDKVKTNGKIREVPAIESGTVIDHIPADVTLKIYDILKCGDNLTTIGINLSSKGLGKKGIIKISDKELDSHVINKIALIAPRVTMNIIKDFKVKEKVQLEVPDKITNIIKCNNPICVTNNNPIDTIFDVKERDDKNRPTRVKCHYCERVMEEEDMDLV